MVIIPIWNDFQILSLLPKFNPKFFDRITLVIDEASEEYIRKIREKSTHIKDKLIIIRNKERRGIGYALRKGLHFAIKQKYDIAVIMAGNGKDNPEEIPKLLMPIIEEDFDYVQGSRFKKGGIHKGTPLKRKIFVRLWPIFWTIITGRKQTEVTNGFRAYKLSIFSEEYGININQDWLDRYALEYYIHFKVLKNKNLRFIEVPVSKTYTSKKNYTKINVLRDWKDIVLTPIILFLKIKK